MGLKKKCSDYDNCSSDKYNTDMIQNNIKAVRGKNTPNNQFHDKDSSVTIKNNIVFRYKYGSAVVQSMKWILSSHSTEDKTIAYKKGIQLIHVWKH